MFSLQDLFRSDSLIDLSFIGVSPGKCSLRFRLTMTRFISQASNDMADHCY